MWITDDLEPEDLAARIFSPLIEHHNITNVVRKHRQLGCTFDESGEDQYLHEFEASPVHRAVKKVYMQTYHSRGTGIFTIAH